MVVVEVLLVWNGSSRKGSTLAVVHVCEGRCQRSLLDLDGS